MGQCYTTCNPREGGASDLRNTVNGQRNSIQPQQRLRGNHNRVKSTHTIVSDYSFINSVQQTDNNAHNSNMMMSQIDQEYQMRQGSVFDQYQIEQNSKSIIGSNIYSNSLIPGQLTNQNTFAESNLPRLNSKFNHKHNQSGNSSNLDFQICDYKYGQANKSPNLGRKIAHHKVQSEDLRFRDFQKSLIQQPSLLSNQEQMVVSSFINIEEQDALYSNQQTKKQQKQKKIKLNKNEIMQQQQREMLNLMRKQNKHLFLKDYTKEEIQSYGPSTEEIIHLTTKNRTKVELIVQKKQQLMQQYDVVYEKKLKLESKATSILKEESVDVSKSILLQPKKTKKGLIRNLFQTFTETNQEVNIDIQSRYNQDTKTFVDSKVPQFGFSDGKVQIDIDTCKFFSAQAKLLSFNQQLKIQKQQTFDDQSNQSTEFAVNNAFILYYDKSDKSQQNKKFQIGLLIDDSKQQQLIGSSHTYMINQFKSGQIFEKEIKFSNHTASFIELRDKQELKKSKTSKNLYVEEGSVTIKIQMFEDEQSNVEEQLQNIDGKLTYLQEQLDIIDNFLFNRTKQTVNFQSIITKEAAFLNDKNSDREGTQNSELDTAQNTKNLGETTPTTTFQDDYKSSTSPKSAVKTFIHSDLGLEQNQNNSEMDLIENIDELENQQNFYMEDQAYSRQSQNAGFYQCQLMFMDTQNPSPYDNNYEQGSQKQQESANQQDIYETVTSGKQNLIMSKLSQNFHLE
eukprot:403338847